MATRHATRQLIHSRRIGAPRRQASTSAHADDFTYPAEAFSSILWPISAVAAIGSFFAYRVSARHALTPTAPLDKTEEGFPAEAEDEKKPFLTRYLAYHFPLKSVWKERNDRHMGMALQRADDQLLLQDAEKPRMRRKRYVQEFEQASPHAIAVGSQADLSDLKINYNFRPNLPPKEDDGEHHGH